MTEWKLLSRHTFPLRWVDIDSYQHLNNAKYYDLMTESRAIAFIEFVNDCNFVVVENSCKYRQAIRYPSAVIVEQYVQNVCSTTFECIYLIKNTIAETVCAKGYAKIVCCRPSDNKICKLPEKLKLFLSNL